MKEVRNSKGEKLYPFSVRRNGHNIELAYNHQWLICREMEDGEREWDNRAFEQMERISEAYCAITPCGADGIAWVNGKTYAVLKDASDWAVCYRDSRN